MKISYSKWKTYADCPRKFKYRYVDKIGGEGYKSPAMQRGTDIHGTCEEFLKGQSDRLHPDIHGFYGQFFFALREAGALPEVEIEVNADWEQVPWGSEEGMVRSVIDILVPPKDNKVRIFELKTGRMYDDHFLQRDLYSVKAFSLYPDIEEARTDGVYLDLQTNSPLPSVLSKSKAESSKNLWNRRVERVNTDETFTAMPQQACRWCEFSRGKGGPCQF